MKLSPQRLVLGLCVAFVLATPGRADPPRVLDPGYRLELFAAEPDIVTPIGLAFGAGARLLVIESHTHFRPEGYQGPPKDRIRVVEDTDGDGKADSFRTFYEGTEATMSLTCRPDGSVYVATRAKIFRLRDTDGDGKADDEKTLVRLETPGNYPHNGLCGLAFDGDGLLIFGLGENLGEAYRLIGSDGRVLSGGGEGGNIYRCRADGGKLEKLATGLWNPFGICVDLHGRIFTVENDPDSRPPCRLLHVVEGGDYGFQFRYGRSGQHPLQAWDGELPGTLPMVAGTGEAPGAVLPYRGDLWVTSWGDHRVEKFTLQPAGASWRAKAATVVQGDNNFRPVGAAVAPDGSLYFTDWVDRSYPVHGMGRIWRLVPKERSPQAKLPELTKAEKAAAVAKTRVDRPALQSDDPFLWQAGVWGLITTDRAMSLDWGALNSRQRLGELQALRWQNASADAILPTSLRDPDPTVRLLAVRWVADNKLVKYRDEVLAQLSRDGGTFPLYRAALAALVWLDQGQVSGKGGRDPAGLFLGFLKDPRQSPTLQLWSLRSIPPDHPGLSLDLLTSLLASKEAELQREAVRTLALSGEPGRFDVLAKVAQNSSAPVQLRADAVAGLADAPGRYRELLEKLATSDAAPIRVEALRSLRALGREHAFQPEPGPEATDIDAWVNKLEGHGDPEAGRRAFFSSQGPQCSRCHAVAGRGADVGPNLTGIGRQLDRRRLIESILQPGREVGPQYQNWLVERQNGTTVTGMSLGSVEDGRQERFLGADGKVTTLDTRDIAARHPSPSSVMPDGLERTMSAQDFRDILAFLAASR